MHPATIPMAAVNCHETRQGAHDLADSMHGMRPLSLPVDIDAYIADAALQVELLPFNGTVSAFTSRIDAKQPVIMFVTDVQSSRLRMQKAIAYGWALHAQLSGDDSFLSLESDDLERNLWAQEFATALLFPGWHAQDMYSQGADIPDLARTFGVSLEDVAMHLGLPYQPHQDSQ